METSDGKVAFFISPIGETLSPARRRSDKLLSWVIRPVLNDLGVDITRADEDNDPGQITSAMVSRIVESDIVVADMSGRNPNVFYELGLADAFQKPVISFSQKDEVRPFDTFNKRSIEVETSDEGSLDADEAESAKERFKPLVAKALDPSFVVTSIVVDATNSRARERWEESAAGTSNADMLIMRELDRLNEKVDAMRDGSSDVVYSADETGDALASWRRSEGLTRAQVGELIGGSQRTVALIEAGDAAIARRFHDGLQQLTLTSSSRESRWLAANLRDLGAPDR